jgi:hypothetical protein
MKSINKKQFLLKVLFAVVVLLTIVLGWLGFREALPQSGYLTPLYLTLQLFTLESGSVVETELPWSLQVARWLAAIISTSAILRLGWSYIQKSRHENRLNGIKGHTIIFGQGAAVQSYLNGHEPTDNGETLVLLSANKTLTENWVQRGGLAVVIEDESASQHNLTTAGLEKAAHLLLLDINDKHNLQVALLAQSISTTPEIILRQDHPATRDLIQRNELSPKNTNPRLRIISIEVSRARELFNRVPLEVTPRGLASEVHLAISGQGPFEQAAAVQAALIGHYPNEGKVHLWLDSIEARSALLRSYPGIVHCVNLSKDIVPFEHLPQHLPKEAALTILATDTTPVEGLIKALRYRESWQPRKQELTLKVILSGPLPKQKEEKEEEQYKWIHHLQPLEDFTSSRDNLINDELDKVAASIHDTWYQKHQTKIAAAETEKDKAELLFKPTNKPWDQLTEYQKDCNRAAADHIKVKIRAVGLDPKQSDLLKAWQDLTEEKDQIELLARVEHERWAAPLWINGYTYAQGERSEPNRTHPCLIPYDRLDENIKGNDKRQVEAAVENLLRNGTCQRTL